MPRNPTTGIYARIDNSFSDPVLGEVIDPTDAIDFWDDLTDALNDIPAEVVGPGLIPFDTRADAEAATIPASVEITALNGYAAVGDTPPQRYTRISTPSPAKGYHFQSADGQWWQLADMEIAAESVGAVGDWNGSAGTNDTQAWKDVASYIELMGGVSVKCMPNKQYLIFPESGGTPGFQALIGITSTDGWSIDFNGSRLVTNNDFNAQASAIYCILATTCENIGVYNFYLDHSAISGVLSSAFGMTGVYFNGCVNGVIQDTTQVGGSNTIQLAGTQPFGDASVRTQGIRVSNVNSDTVYYGVETQFADNIFITGHKTNNAGRSFFVNNTSNIYCQLHALNGGPFDDVIIGVLAVAGASANTNTTSNVEIDYFNPVRTAVLSGNDSLVRLNFQQNSASTASGTIKNVHVRFAVDGATHSSTNGIIAVKSAFGGTIPDATPRGYTIDNVAFSGRFNNWTSGKVANLFDATYWGTAGGDFVRNIIFRDLMYEGAGSTLNVNATYVDRNLDFENVLGTTNLNITGAAAGVLRTRNLRVPNVSEILVLSGFTSGSVTIQPQAAAGTYNFNLPTSAGTSGQPLLSGGGGAAAQTYGTLGVAAGGTGAATAAAARTALGAIGTVTKQVFTGSGTYTPTAGMISCIIECLGGGGGGGGIFGDAAASLTGGGGGAGSYARKYATAADIGASKTVTIGALGAGGTAGANNGSVGGDTSVGSLCVGKGGAGGLYTKVAVQNGQGGAGGVAGTGDVTTTGAPGQCYLPSFGTTGIGIAGGNGGSSQFGGGGLGAAGSNGAAATGYGGGGAGGAAYDNTNKSGGNGSAGIVIVTEFLA